MCPNPIVNVPIRNRIVQVQSEQAANSGVVRISTHNREGHSPRVRSYLAYLYCYYSKPYQFDFFNVARTRWETYREETAVPKARANKPQIAARSAAAPTTGILLSP